MKKQFIVALVAAIAAAGTVYWKIPAAREWVDLKCPELHPKLIALVALWDHHITVPSQPPAPIKTGLPTPIISAQSTPVNESPVAIPPSVSPASTPSMQSETVDMAQLEQSRAEWPKTVTLKKAMVFPAVIDGKIIGNVTAPLGTQAFLILIKNGVLGLEYQGGGAMVSAAETDLIERIQFARNGNPAIRTPTLVAAVAHGANPATPSKTPTGVDTLTGLSFDNSSKTQSATAH